MWRNYKQSVQFFETQNNVQDNVGECDFCENNKEGSFGWAIDKVSFPILLRCQKNLPASLH